MKKAAAIVIALAFAFAWIPGVALAATHTVADANELLLAVTAAEDGDIIQLTGPVDLGGDCLVIEKTLTLDLNGCAVSGTGVNDLSAVVCIGETGCLTVCDTPGDGSISAPAGSAVLNDGSMSISGAVAINAWGSGSIGLQTNGEVIITGALTLTAAAGQALSISGGTVAVEPGASLTIAAGQAYIGAGGTLNNNGALNVALGATLVNEGTLNDPPETGEPSPDPAASPDPSAASEAEGFFEAEGFSEITYTVIIPATVDFGTIRRGTDVQKVDFSVTVTGASIDSGASIKVTNTTAEMFMRDKDGTGDIKLPFELEPEMFTFLYSDLTGGSMTIDSHVSCDPDDLQAAGSYRGIMTFSIEYIAP